MWKQSISLRDNRVKWITSNSQAEAGVPSAGIVDEEGDSGAGDDGLDAATTAASLLIGCLRMNATRGTSAWSGGLQTSATSSCVLS